MADWNEGFTAEEEAAPSTREAPGVALRRFRKEAGFSLKDVAARLADGTHFTTVGKLERGKMELTYGWALRLGKVLNRAALEFYIEEEQKNRAQQVPIYSGMYDFNNGLVGEYTAYFSRHEYFIAFMVMSNNPDILDETPLYCAVVNPERKTLFNHGPFCFYKRDTGDVCLGVFRKEPDRLLPWITTSYGPTLLPDDNIEVLGLVMEVQRHVASRNS